MKFLNRFFSSLETYIQRNICRTMFNSYKKSKKVNPNVGERELCVLTLSFRPTYKRNSINPYVFNKGKHEIFITETDGIKDLIKKVIYIETYPGIIDAREDIKHMVKIMQIIDEEIK